MLEFTSLYHYNVHSGLQWGFVTAPLMNTKYRGHKATLRSQTYLSTIQYNYTTTLLELYSQAVCYL